MNKRRIIFRADGNSQIGLGHVVRSLALADMLKDDFTCIFAIQNPSEAIIEQIETICDYIIALPRVENYIEEAHHLVNKFLKAGDILILDGYFFNTDYQQIIKNNGDKLVCIDDIYNYHFVSDAVINHAGRIDPLLYSRENYTKFYVGPRYALLRKEFLKAAQESSKNICFNNILICMGGADPDNHTKKILLQVLEAASSQYNEINILIGSSYLYEKELNNLVARVNKKIIIHKNLGASDVEQLMQNCGSAICSPSSVSYEYCAVRGLLFLYQTFDNQRNIYNFLVNARCALPYKGSESLLVSEQLKDEVVTSQKKIFDGLSPIRFRLLFQALQMNLKLRKAKTQDNKLYFDWANEPSVRMNAIHREPIVWENHKLWFEKKIYCSSSYLYVVENKERPIGQIRIDFEGDIGTIDYSIDKEYRGIGLGKIIVWLAIEELEREMQCGFTLRALVKEKNIPSCKVFQKLNFNHKEDVQIDNENYFLFEHQIYSS